MLACAVAGALVLAGCGGGQGGGTGDPSGYGSQDVNPRDPDSLRDGGTLRLPLNDLPVNYNYNHVDGHGEWARDVLWALMPRAFDQSKDGDPVLNADLLTDAGLVSTLPQVIRYRINDRAVWSNGRPITWEDFAAQVRANNGSDPAFRFVDKTGYADIERVERGGTDKEVLVTLRRPFAEWQGRLFYGLYPKEMNGDPAEFNGWHTEPKITAGPFRVEKIDTTARSIALVRNERWWGRPPRLDRITWTAGDRAWPDRLADNEIDAYEIDANVDLLDRARAIPGVKIRRAATGQRTHITFNGAPGRPLADPALRRAVAKAIDREAIAQRVIGPIVGWAKPLGNHIYPIGSKGYRDNAGAAPTTTFDPESANRELDALGWVRQGSGTGSIRARGGQPLRLNLVIFRDDLEYEQIAKEIAVQLVEVGVEVVIEPVPSARFYPDFVHAGNFDLTAFGWVLTGPPFSDSVSIYQEPKGGDVGLNYGRIHDPVISEKFAEGTAELDNSKRIEIGNEIDRLVWDEVHHLPLYAEPGAYAVRENLANYGARGLADWDYTKVGFNP
ncbi:ABC transporter family substrate-binding protein [Pseudonocardia acaciae]|uniref:ABC transporter family substrate-binding protein n=1 Tax=Pseudonocardia acaciae TaxID=551276 RepID=UPI0014704504|nr:ABC transporter family substrate-binding protein [Pseudonocardia acaciae]